MDLNEALRTNPAVRDFTDEPVTDAELLELLEVAPAGRKRMPASDWARGARIEPHERLG